MSKVNTSKAMLDNASSLCKRALDMLFQTQKSLQSNYTKAEDDWEDSKYLQLGEIIQECNISFKKNTQDINNCLNTLKNLEQCLQDYENINLGESFSQSGNYSQPVQMSFTGIYGGSYKDCKKLSTGLSGHEEVHHIPAASISSISYNDSPAITMSKADHQNTASYDSKAGARAYRQKQNDLIQQGRFQEALQMDIEDIRFKFGNKYDQGINAVIIYTQQLRSEGRI